MATYYLNEGAFELPEVGLVDRTVNVFDAKLEGEGDLGLLVCRTKIPAGKSLRELVAAHVLHEAKRFGGYSILDEREASYAGVPAIEICSRWRHEGTVLYQRQAHLAAFDTWMLFGMTAPLAERALCDASLDRILTTLRLRDRD